MSSRCTSTLAIALAAGVAASADAQTIYPEIEPNNSKAEALMHPPFLLASGDGITGSSLAATDPDFFIIKTAPASPGIYRHRLVLTSSTPGHAVSIRGLSQTGATAGTWPCTSTGTPGTADNAAQTAQTVGTDRNSQWYGFGKGEQIFYRVAGTTNTTSDYTAILETTPVAPMDIGSFQAGIITIHTIDQGHTTDTDIWVYDGDFNAIPGYGNDGASTNGGAPLNSLTPVWLQREYPPGEYYLAMTNFNFANNQTSPCDDGYRTGTILDFPDAALNSSTSTNNNLSFAVIDDAGTMAFPAFKAEPFEIVWVKFTVTGTISTGACCFATGSCENLTQLACATQGGNYSGNGTECAATPCPQPGACCLASGTCIETLEADCTSQGGVFSGGGTTCAGIPACPQPGACCFTNNCSVVMEQTCLAGGGLFRGDGTLCDASANCPGIYIEVGDAGELMLDSFEVAGSGVLTVIQGTLTPNAGDMADLFKISICDYQNFSASTVGGTSWDTILSLVDENGYGITLNVDEVGGTTVQSRITSQFIPGDGTYYLGISRFSRVPGDSAAQRIWETSPWRAERQPDGPGAANPLASWVTNVTTAAGPYRIDLTGACFLDTTPPCYANCDGSTNEPILTVDDFTCFINEFAQAQGLPHEQQVTHYANCDGSTLAPALTVDDFTCFINAFAQGCQ